MKIGEKVNKAGGVVKDAADSLAKVQQKEAFAKLRLASPVHSSFPLKPSTDCWPVAVVPAKLQSTPHRHPTSTSHIITQHFPCLPQMTQQQSKNTADPASRTTQVVVKHGDAEKFVIALLEASGASPKNAEIVARGLVQADLRGVESHGINRLPSYLARVRNAVLDPSAEPTLHQVTPVVAQVGDIYIFNMHTRLLMYYGKKKHL